MIRKAESKDLYILSELACRLWPDHTVEEMCSEFADMIAKPDAVFFLAYAALLSINLKKLLKIAGDCGKIYISLALRLQ